MTEPGYLSYQNVDLHAADRSYLNVLSILHDVWGGLEILFACFGLFYVAVAVMMLSGTFPPGNTPGMTPAQLQQQQQAMTIGGSFIVPIGHWSLRFDWDLGLEISQLRVFLRHALRFFDRIFLGVVQQLRAERGWQIDLQIVRQHQHPAEDI